MIYRKICDIGSTKFNIVSDDTMEYCLLIVLKKRIVVKLIGKLNRITVLTDKKLPVNNLLVNVE